MTGVEILGLAWALLVGLGAYESFTHRRRLDQIPTRIHVSGTRGKSSVTRLIAAGMRKAGIPTAAKTTGTLARMILPSGREVPVFRPSGANIIEQIRIVNAARSIDAKALVLECMALQPELHWISEKMFVRATHGVITNVRADHLDVMGPTVTDVGRTLASMTPIGGTLITGEREHLDILKMAAEDRKTRLVHVTDEDMASIDDQEMSRFSYVEHRENVALALKVLHELEVPREIALSGMWEATPDPGALAEYEVDFFGRRIIFVNAFAANDPQSTGMIWEMIRAKHPDVKKTVAVFNLRGDRPSRTIQLAKDAMFWKEADKVVLMGSGAYLFARVASRNGLDPTRFTFADLPRVEDIVEMIIGLCGRSTLVIGMANIGGQGLDLVRYFRNRQILPSGAA